MLIIGLTGSIGMGKSTVAKRFVTQGVPVCDADALVHEIYRGPSVALIEAAFPGTTGPQGVDRAALGAKVFGDPDALARLESIVHPAVAQLREAFLLEHAGMDLVVFDVPLLFEKGGFQNVDAVLVVSAPAGVQRQRVLARPGMDPAKFSRILDIQVPDAEKRARADHVIDTGCSLEETRAAVKMLIKSLRDRAI